MIIIDIASLFKQYNATNYSMQIKQLCRGPYLARAPGDRPIRPPLNPPLVIGKQEAEYH